MPKQVAREFRLPREITPALIAEWKRHHAPDLIDALLFRIDLPTLPLLVDELLNWLVYRNQLPYSQQFLEADLARRRSEGLMVAEEVGMFREIRTLLETANAHYRVLPLMSSAAPMAGSDAAPAGSEVASPADAISRPITAVAGLVQGLAEKNKTMKEGYPGVPPPTGGGGDGHGLPPTQEKPPCYEKYKKRIEELWRQKEIMGDNFMWTLQWLDALKDLTLCAGPEVVKVLLDLLKAGQGK